MEQKKIDRINELARKAKAEGLTEEETKERDILRREYIDSFKASLVSSSTSIDLNIFILLPSLMLRLLSLL